MTVLDLLNFENIIIRERHNSVKFEFKIPHITYKLLKYKSIVEIKKYGKYRRLIFIDSLCPQENDIHFLEDRI